MGGFTMKRLFVLVSLVMAALFITAPKKPTNKQTNKQKNTLPQDNYFGQLAKSLPLGDEE